MTTFGAALNEDTNGRRTSARYEDRGDGVDDWVLWVKLAATGAIDDTAVTDPTADGSVTALLKGLLGVRHAEDVAAASGDAGVSVLAVRNDTLAARTSTDGDYGAVSVAAAGELLALLAAKNTSTDTAPLNATTTALDDALVVKGSAGTLFGISGHNTGPDQFVQVHDAASTPSDTAVPKLVIFVAADSNFSIDLGVYGRRFTNGIVICNSSTAATKTIGSADLWIDAQYR